MWESVLEVYSFSFTHKMRDSWYNGLSASFLEDDKRQNAGRLRQIERIRMRWFLVEKLKCIFTNSEDARRLREQKEVAIVEHRRAYLAERQIRVSIFKIKATFTIMEVII